MKWDERKLTCLIMINCLAIGKFIKKCLQFLLYEPLKNVCASFLCVMSNIVEYTRKILCTSIAVIQDCLLVLWVYLMYVIPIQYQECYGSIIHGFVADLPMYKIIIVDVITKSVHTIFLFKDFFPHFKGKNL